MHTVGCLGICVMDVIEDNAIHQCDLVEHLFILDLDDGCEDEDMAVVDLRSNRIKEKEVNLKYLQL